MKTGIQALNFYSFYKIKKVYDRDVFSEVVLNKFLYREY